MRPFNLSFPSPPHPSPPPPSLAGRQAGGGNKASGIVFLSCRSPQVPTCQYPRQRLWLGRGSVNLLTRCRATREPLSHLPRRGPPLTAHLSPQSTTPKRLDAPESLSDISHPLLKRSALGWRISKCRKGPNSSCCRVKRGWGVALVWLTTLARLP